MENPKERNGINHPDNQTSLKTVNNPLQQMNTLLKKNKQRFVDLQSKWVDGSWTLEFQSILVEERWEQERRNCRPHLGCCGRVCECCHKSRPAYAIDCTLYRTPFFSKRHHARKEQLKEAGRESHWIVSENGMGQRQSSASSCLTMM